MPYLIDGHNLIGQLPTIRLDDPDDEAKLVRLLQRFAMTRKVKVAVVFDRGYFGRQSLGGHGVAVRFARSPSDADEIIKNQLRAFAAPREWVLVSSDREIAAVAREVGANVITARDFAETLGAMGAADPASAERAEAHAHVRGDKVGEWLDLFGVDAEEASKPIDLQRKPEPPPAPQAARTAARTGTLPKKKPAQPKPPVVPRTPPRRWEEPPQRPGRPEPLPREADGTPRRSRGGPKPISSQGEPLFKPPPPVHPDEIDEWLQFFGEDEGR